MLANGGGTSGSPTATGGGGGGGFGADVFNPALPRPSGDCRDDAEYKNCASLAGTLDGTAVDARCGSATPISFLDSGRWLFGCGTGADPHFRVYVAPRRAGHFAEATVAADSSHPFDVRVSRTDASGKVSSASVLDDNFVRAELAGDAVKLANDNIVVTGTVHAVWTTPAATCRPQGGDRCLEAELNGTFSAEQIYGNCIDGSDCASGKCVPEGATCFQQQ